MSDLFYPFPTRASEQEDREPDRTLPGIEVKEVSWEEWDVSNFGAITPVAQQLMFPTLMDWRIGVSGCVTGQLLHHPTLPYGCSHHTARILEVRKFDSTRQPVAFTADGTSYRLGPPNRDMRLAALEWLQFMLEEDCSLPLIVHRPRRGDVDAFGLQQAR